MSEPWRFLRFGLIITGRAEERFLPVLLRSLAATGRCTFTVLRRINQLSPITSETRRLRMVGGNKEIPARDIEDIGLEARRFLRQDPDSYVLLIDDLEHARRPDRAAVYARYRAALDEALTPDLRGRASVHFLVNMLEAYYFAHADAINECLQTELADHDGDVEQIRNPKGVLKGLRPGFDEIHDGERIVRRLDLERVLGDPETCASLRTLVKWCWLALGLDLSDRYRLLDGVCCSVTGTQLPASAPD